MTTKKMPTVTVELDEVKKMIQEHAKLLISVRDTYNAYCGCGWCQEMKNQLSTFTARIDNAIA